MRLYFTQVLLITAMCTTPAIAGNASLTNGQGTWQSTQCVSPTPPSPEAHDPETPANDVNLRVTQHNQYVQAANDYMKCISTEAQHDADTMSQAIVSAAQAVMHDTQALVDASAAPLQQSVAK